MIPGVCCYFSKSAHGKIRQILINRIWVIIRWGFIALFFFLLFSQEGSVNILKVSASKEAYQLMELFLKTGLVAQT